MADTKSTSRSPWFWIPTLYMAEGLPYALVTSVSLVLYKNLDVPNGTITFWSALLGLPWIFKPLWGPMVDSLHTRRLWAWVMQLVMGAILAGVALALPLPGFFGATLAMFWLLAFASATHDIAADGFYLLALAEGDQSLFSGVRNTFYRVANIAAQGGLVIFAGKMHALTGSFATAWLLAFALAAGGVFGLAVYHRSALPRPAADVAKASGEKFSKNSVETFTAFFRRPRIVPMLAFVLFYRLGEAQLLPVAKLFLLDPCARGGLGLTNEQYGWVYGTFGLGALLAGGLIGGYVVSQRGLKFWLWPMLFAIHLPDTVFIWLAYAQPQNLLAIGAGVAVEQFGYGFGFTAFMLYLIRIARGPHATAHYALCTGFMQLGITLPGMWSGGLQEWIGYPHFFIWVILATIPSFLVAMKIPLDAEFGKRT
jgi:MFS transporter, PAT family, beta-lactamase induction signal transducer AmpG